MDHIILELKNIISKEVENSREHLDKNKGAKYTKWKRIIFIILGIYILITVFLPFFFEDKCLIALLVIVDIVFIFFAVPSTKKLDKYDQSDELYSETVKQLSDAFSKENSPFSINQLERIYNNYKSTTAITFTKVQIVMSAISLFFFSIVVTCIPKSIDFISHLLTPKGKLLAFIYFWSVMFALFLFIVLSIKPVFRLILKDSAYDTMEYISSILVNESAKMDEEKSSQDNFIIYFPYQQEPWYTRLFKHRE